MNCNWTEEQERSHQDLFIGIKCLIAFVTKSLILVFDQMTSIRYKAVHISSIIVGSQTV